MKRYVVQVRQWSEFRLPTIVCVSLPLLPLANTAIAQLGQLERVHGSKFSQCFPDCHCWCALAFDHVLEVAHGLPVGAEQMQW